MAIGKSRKCELIGTPDEYKKYHSATGLKVPFEYIHSIEYERESRKQAVAYWRDALSEIFSLVYSIKRPRQFRHINEYKYFSLNSMKLILYFKVRNPERTFYSIYYQMKPRKSVVELRVS